MKKNRKDAYVTLEFAVAIIVIAIPLLLAVSEVYRVEHYVRKTLFQGQRRCMERAAAENKGGPRRISERLVCQVELLPATRRVFGGNWEKTEHEFERTYYIYTGTGKE